jgi:bile acid:Na+ symporter, BASS family
VLLVNIGRHWSAFDGLVTAYDGLLTAWPDHPRDAGRQPSEYRRRGRQQSRGRSAGCSQPDVGRLGTVGLLYIAAVLLALRQASSSRPAIGGDAVALVTVVQFLLTTSTVLTVFGLTLYASLDDVMYLFRHPAELARSLLSMNIIMPLFAAAIAAALDLHPAVKIALITLAVSPVPPLFWQKAVKAAGRVSYAIGLPVAAALLAIIFVPVAVELLGRAFGRPAHVSPVTVAQVVSSTVPVPLAAGVAVRHFAPTLAERITKPVYLVAAALLLAGAILTVFAAWSAIISLIGNGTIIAIAAFVIAGLGTGHLLGGPDPENRTVLALSTASRHPGIALTIANANFPNQRFVPAAVLLYVIINAVVSLPYWTRRQRHHV